MKKIILGLITITGLLTSCKKDTETTVSVTGDLTITAQFEGKPVKDAEIYLYSAIAEGTAINQDAKTEDIQTDADGKITFEKLLKGSYFVETYIVADLDDNGINEGYYGNKGFIVKTGDKNEIILELFLD